MRGSGVFILCKKATRAEAKRKTSHIETVDDGYGCDGRLDGPHPLVERVLCLVRADDRPRRAVVDHLLVRFFGARSRLQGNNVYHSKSSFLLQGFQLIVFAFN